MTQKELLELVTAFGPSILSGIGQGGQASADRAQTALEQQRLAEQEAYNRRQGARAGLAGFFQNQLNRDINAAGDFASLSPLGAEQALARQTARMRAGGQAAAQYRPPTGMSPAASAFAAQQPNFLAPFGGADYQATVSPEATARSIAERRKALAGIDPNFQFGSMGDFGLPDLGGEVSQYQGDVRSRRQASEMDLQRLLTEQMREASAAQIPGATSATGAPATGTTTQKKPSALRRIVGAALPVAAAFIPGVGPVASALIQAGAGAAGSAIAGGGLKGALTGAAMGGLGAATGGLGSAASRMGANGAKGGLGSFVQRAILDPRALTQIAGGVIGGDAGTALQAASLGMGRIPSAGGRTFDTSFEQQGLPSSMLPGGGMYKEMTTDLGKGPFDTSFEQQAVPGLLPVPGGGGTLTTDIGPAPRRRPARRQPAAPETASPLSLDIQRELERSMSRRDLQALPPNTLTREGLQLAYGPAAGAMQMLGSAEGPPSGEEIMGDATRAAILMGGLSRFLPASMLPAANAAGAATVTGQAVRNMPRMLTSGARSPLRLPAGAPRLGLPGTQSIPLPQGGGVLTRDVGSPFLRLPGGGIMYR